VVNVWNSLLEYVINSENVNEFEKNLDKVWSDQEQRFKYRAVIMHSHLDHPSNYPVSGGDLELES